MTAVPNSLDTNFSDSKKVDTEADYVTELYRSIQSIRASVNIILPSKINTRKLFSDFMNTYRTFFSNLESIDCTRYSKSGSPDVILHYDFHYRIGRVKLHLMAEAVNARIVELGRTIFHPSLPSEIKALIAHNYLIRSVEYWNSEDANMLERSYMQSAYGALVNGKCVCQGFAEAYKLLLDSQGVKCEVVCGKRRGSEVNHAWNIVSFDGIRYSHVDVTWDAGQSGRDSHRYYCLSDDEIKSDRLWTRPKGIVCGNADDLRKKTKSILERNKESYSLLVADRGLLFYYGDGK